MTTTVELERAGTFEPITYGDFEIENGTSDVRIAPEATITTANSVPVESNQRVRIVIDGVTRFLGRTTSEGTRRRNGQRRVRAEHEAYRVFDEAVSVGPTSDAATVLQDAIAATSFAAGLSVSYTGTSETLTEAYEVTDRKVKSIFRDIVDRTNRVWWVGADGTITVQPRGGRGEWTSVSLPGDDAAIDSYEAGDVRSVVNDVTVVGTGEERVEGNATDSTSISEYGKRSETFNLQYVTTASEADAAAAELLQPTPLDSASVIVGGSVGTNPDQNLSNFTISLSDNSLGLAGDSFIIESQSVEQGRVTLEVGEAATNGIDSVNRASKSRGDVTTLGNVVGSGSLGDNSVDTPQLVDTAVIEQKLADAGVTNGKLANLSVDETKVQDSSISTPKLQAEAVTASEIAADTITAAQIAAGTITALEIAADEITANEIDTLDLDTAEISIGTDADQSLEFTTETVGASTAVRVVPNGLATLGGDSDRFTRSYFNRSNVTFLEIESSAIPTASDVDLGTSTDEFDTLYVNGVVVNNNVNADGEVSGGSLFSGGNLTVLGDGDIDTLETTDLTISDAGADIVTVFADSGTSLRPSVDNEGALGTNTAAWATVTAHNIFEQTPEPLDPADPVDGVDLDELKGTSWEQPPAYVAKRKANAEDDREYVRQNPNKSGVELGHMTNYLLETCKAQQERIDDLESRLADVESQVGPNA